MFNFLWRVSLIWLLATIWRDGSSKTISFDRKRCKQQHKRQQAERKLLVQLRAENHALLESGESRTCNVEKSIARLTRGTFLLYVDLVTYMSISEVLVKTCWSNATTAKIWSLRNFCQFYARQKLEVNKIGSSATRPLVGKPHIPSVVYPCLLWYDRSSSFTNTTQCWKLMVRGVKILLRAEDAHSWFVWAYAWCTTNIRTDTFLFVADTLSKVTTCYYKLYLHCTRKKPWFLKIYIYLLAKMISVATSAYL